MATETPNFVIPKEVEIKRTNAFRIGLLKTGEAYLEFGIVDIETKNVEIFSRVTLSESALKALANMLVDAVDESKDAQTKEEGEE